MTRDEVKQLYQCYRANQEKVKSTEEGLLSVADREQWLNKLTEKSTALREMYRENEALLERTVRPYLKKEKELSPEIASEFLEQITDMIINCESDFVLLTEMLQLLCEYFEQTGMLSEQVLSTFFLATSYADRANPEYSSYAMKYYGEVCEFSDKYAEFDDWDVRRRILFSHYNLLANFYYSDSKAYQNLIDVWEQTERFCLSEDVRRLDADKIPPEEFLEECRDSVKWNITSNYQYPAPALIDYVGRRFVSPEISADNLTGQKSADAVIYIWYRYWSGEIDCNDCVRLLFRYYCSNDKTIDYSRMDFYSCEEYQTQIAFMQECLRYLGMPECDMPEKASVLSAMKKDFKRLYENVPYLSSNGLMNADMIEILHQLLRLVTDEDEAMTYIREVIIRRNTMTLIHSTMVAKLTATVMDALITKAPELFLELSGAQDTAQVQARRDELLQYAKTAAAIHDIGKIWISDIINLQTRRLNDEEFRMIQQHPELGNNIIKNTLLEEKYSDIILGHHRTFDGTGGYPKEYDVSDSPRKILIDLITICDCIDAATDTLGRNYTSGKRWIPELSNELLQDGGRRYNPVLVDFICSDSELCSTLQDMTGPGRIQAYYDIYRLYLQ